MQFDKNNYYGTCNYIIKVWSVSVKIVSVKCVYVRT